MINILLQMRSNNYMNKNINSIQSFLLDNNILDELIKDENSNFVDDLVNLVNKDKIKFIQNHVVWIEAEAIKWRGINLKLENPDNQNVEAEKATISLYEEKATWFYASKSPQIMDKIIDERAIQILNNTNISKLSNIDKIKLIDIFNDTIPLFREYLLFEYNIPQKFHDFITLRNRLKIKEIPEANAVLGYSKFNSMKFGTEKTVENVNKHYGNKKNPRKKNDSHIYAAAKAHNAILITENKKDFEKSKRVFPFEGFKTFIYFNYSDE